VPKGSNPITYFETSPQKPTTTNKVTFDASFSRTASGKTNGLKYFWDFGDGTTVATNSPTVTHTFSSTSPAWYQVKLVVKDGSRMGFYQQALAVEFNPTHFPATPPAGEPTPPNTDPCGTLSSSGQSATAQLANQAFGQLTSDNVVRGQAPLASSS
jgi:hypothetical protein